jgi:glucose 1-dehydrogenase
LLRFLSIGSLYSYALHRVSVVQESLHNKVVIVMVHARLHGLRSFITGGSRGIGRAVAERFAAEGAVIIINHFRDDEEAALTLESLKAISAKNGFDANAHRIIAADVSDRASIHHAIDMAVKEAGRLDCLINNAGIQAETPGNGFDAATFEKIVAVNLMGAAYASEKAIAHFLSREGGGSIINTTSVHELIPKPSFLAYSISKGGLSNLTRTLALEYADRGIRVNAVGPGAVSTSLNDAWRHDPKAVSVVENHIPMRRVATPEDVAGVYAFLASADANYITGQTVFACGGITLFGDFQTNWSS